MLVVWSLAACQAARVRDVGVKHARFAKELAAVDMTMEDLSGGIAEEVQTSRCSVPSSLAARLTRPQLAGARAYATLYCQPWRQLWDDALAPCAGASRITSCDELGGLDQRIDLNTYLDVIAAALRTSASERERDNLIGLVLNLVRAHILTEFSPGAAEPGVGRAVETYLASAKGSRAIWLAEQLQASFVGLAPAVVEAFMTYARESPMPSVLERDKLARLLAKRFAD